MCENVFLFCSDGQARVNRCRQRPLVASPRHKAIWPDSRSVSGGGAGFIVSRWLCPRLIHRRRLIDVPWPPPRYSQLRSAIEVYDFFSNFSLFFLFFITFFLSMKDRRIKTTGDNSQNLYVSKLDSGHYLILSR